MAVASADFSWAVIFLVGCKKDPFTKTPLVPNTVLSAQAVVGLEQEQRLVNCNGSVANNMVAQYKIFMFCGAEFFGHVTNITELLNAYFEYLMTYPYAEFARDTAYTMCMALLPGETKRGVGLHVNVSPFHLKAITRNPGNLTDIKAIRFEPHPLMDPEVVKYVKIENHL